MSSHRTQTVLYETEAALRLVDHGLSDLREDAVDTEPPADAAIGIVHACHRATTMRDGLSLRMSALNFQGMTSQQLARASAVLTEMEVLLVNIVQPLDANADARGQRQQR